MDLGDAAGARIVKNFEHLVAERKENVQRFMEHQKGADVEVSQEAITCYTFLQSIYKDSNTTANAMYEFVKLPLYPTSDGVEGVLCASRTSRRPSLGFRVHIQLSVNGQSEEVYLGNVVGSAFAFDKFGQPMRSKNTHGVFVRDGEGLAEADKETGYKLIEFIEEAMRYQQHESGEYAHIVVKEQP